MVRSAFVSTYPPRHCGIATFTYDLAMAAGSREIVALHPPDQHEPYTAEVHHRIRRDEFADYIRVARSVSQCVDVVSIQHEYGIWGGDDGGNVLDFARELDVPSVATLHTVLRQPSPQQRVILTGSCQKPQRACWSASTAWMLIGSRSSPTAFRTCRWSTR
jgi:hypothetical protein